MYALILFGILVKFIEKIEKIQRDFLWSSLEGQKIYPFVAWDNVYLPKCYGALGIRKLKHLNMTLVANRFGTSLIV